MNHCAMPNSTKMEIRDRAITLALEILKAKPEILTSGNLGETAAKHFTMFVDGLSEYIKDQK